MRKAIKTTAILAVFLTALLALAVTAAAGAGFLTNPNPNLPENQEPGVVAFFDVWVTPGTTQDLLIDVHNPDSEPIFVEMEVFNAGTTARGHLDYFPEARLDESAPFLFTDITTLPSDARLLTIPAQATATIPLTVNVPTGSFDGASMGAVRIMLGISEEDLAQAGMFVNRFANTIPVRLRMDGTQGQPEPEPDFALGEIGVDLRVGRAAFVADIHHIVPRITRDAVLDVWFFQAGSEEPSMAYLGWDMEFAPNSIFELAMIDEVGYGIPPGDYRIRVRIEREDRVWYLENYFTVETAEAQAMNQGAINQLPMSPLDNVARLPVAVIIAIIVGILLILLLIFLLLRSRKKAAQAQPAAEAPAQPEEAKTDAEANFDQLLKEKGKDELMRMLAQSEQATEVAEPAPEKDQDQS